MGVTHTTKEQVANLYRLNDRMATMLRRLEWAGIERSGTSCPCCGATKLSEPHTSEHFDRCDLASLLRELP